jgi:hypothetical protein
MATADLRIVFFEVCAGNASFRFLSTVKICSELESIGWAGDSFINSPVQGARNKSEKIARRTSIGEYLLKIQFKRQLSNYEFPKPTINPQTVEKTQ